jgi:methylated-DNA-[protein]-cysteine S-methyltransferase
MQLYYGTSITSPVGPLTLVANNNALVAIIWDSIKKTHEQQQKLPSYEICTTQHPILIQTENELKEYFNKERTIFTIPIEFIYGTEFQKNIWSTLQTSIPYGTTCSYKDIGIKINNVNAYRAIGNANNNNPLSIIIPCHRVINSNGSLSGYSGGIIAKEFLLNLEKETKQLTTPN